MKNSILIIRPALLAVILGLLIFLSDFTAFAEDDINDKKDLNIGGGYAVTNQIDNVGYTAELYDATNGLPTSDANYILGTRDGYLWIGGYSGIIRYDGTEFERLDTSDGLTSGRCIYEDSKNRVWVGTNDGGVVMIDKEERTSFTYKDGLPSSSIRSFAEDKEGNIFVGTTAGVAYIDSDMNVNVIDDSRINEERILKLEADDEGVIYCQTANGIMFTINNYKVDKLFNSDELNLEKITTFLLDPHDKSKVYIGTESSTLYHGAFGDDVSRMKRINIEPIFDTHWMTYACNRVWLSSTTVTGYLDENYHFHRVSDIPMDSAIEMMTADYQGNMWYASSTQGVMKIVTNNFVDVTRKAGLEDAVVNATCFHDGKLYVGTDSGLEIISDDRRSTIDKLIKYIGESRIRCIMEDSKGNLWISCFTNEKGLVCQTADGDIKSFTVDNGMPGNEARCTTEDKDGNIVCGTNSGVAIIKNMTVSKVIGAKEGMKNTVILTVCAGDDGEIYVGTDGDGIYVIEGSSLSRIGRDEGLTSDVVMRIKKDEDRGVYWIVTSNSIEYISDGLIMQSTSFPYNNNYDIYFAGEDDMWILSSYGVYMVKASEMIEDNVTDYRLYTINSGLTCTPTANSYSTLSDDGNLYVAGRTGVSRLNVMNYNEMRTEVKIGVRSVYIDDEKITPTDDGAYVIPASDGRIRITAAVMDYTMSDPLIRVFLEESSDEGVKALRSRLTSLEFTDLKYGDYTLHVQVLDKNGKEPVFDKEFKIIKKPRLYELLVFKIIFVILIASLVGFIVFRVMKSTIISRQYQEIQAAKEEAERASSAKTRFLANMSHEIRTPINTIMGMDEMILRENADGVPKPYFMSIINYGLDIKNASESLLGLVNDLLDISKIESGKMTVINQEYDSSEFLRSIVSMIRVRANEKELLFDVSVDEMLPKRLYGDAGKIKQIILNLLTNAVKYTDRGGFVLNISVEGRVDDVIDLRISVKDTGMGIRQEDMDKLFEAYERLDEEKNSSIQGTGLGLDISGRFAELMGGKLICESVYGEGSEFILTLSQKIVDATPMGVFVERDESSDKGPYVPQFIAPDADVLVVDDNPMNLNVIRGLLKATKIFVTTAGSGEECIDKLKESSYNIVLLDHMMPGMDGVETVEKIRQFAPDLPVYALTANATQGEEFYISKGFNGYLSKPVDSILLERTIMKHLPSEMMMKPEAEDGIEELDEIPDDMLWIKDIDGISVDEGIKNSGGITNYIFSLNMFNDTIDDNTRVLNEAYEEGNIRLYTIKVHSLKSSARIVGAMELSTLCQQLEDAGNHEDMEFINDNADKLISEYQAFKEKLMALKEEADDDAKEELDSDNLKNAYDALKEAIPVMDYDAVELVLDKLKDYKLPKEDQDIIDKLNELFKNMDWDGMESLIK